MHIRFTNNEDVDVLLESVGWAKARLRRAHHSLAIARDNAARFAGVAVGTP
jgi:hypothetical protein